MVYAWICYEKAIEARRAEGVIILNKSDLKFNKTHSVNTALWLFSFLDSDLIKNSIFQSFEKLGEMS